ncbi:hypothetical protein PENSPDRAFT_648806 [Peniophora sp. CONT]|nr:hypothetical protein PENSPDRAFT_648806 [Peniophora sp. CONT]
MRSVGRSVGSDEEEVEEGAGVEAAGTLSTVSTPNIFRIYISSIRHRPGVYLSFRTDTSHPNQRTSTLERTYTGLHKHDLGTFPSSIPTIERFPNVRIRARSRPQSSSCWMEPAAPARSRVRPASSLHPTRSKKTGLIVSATFGPELLKAGL